MRRLAAPVLGLLLVVCTPFTAGLVSGQPSGATAADATTGLPDTPVGRQLEWVLAALDDPGSVLTIPAMGEHFAPSFLETISAEAAVTGTQAFARDAGPFTVEGFVRTPTDVQAVVLMTGNRGTRFVAVVATEAVSPHRITNLVFQPAPPSVTAGSAAIKGDLVDIGARRLYLWCTGPDRGAGGPTVVLEAGHGNDSTVWLAVQSALAADVRDCSYDRANAPGGASDPTTTPRTGVDTVADLHALLAEASVPGPYVLVGHSLGGLFVRLYANTYPDDVAGLVLVDPSHEDQEDRIRDLVGPDLWAAQEATAAGYVDPEGFELATIAAEVRTARAAAPLPAVPLVVLSHGLAPDPALAPPGWPVAAEEEVWRTLHADLAGLVPGGRLVVAEESGHFVQTDQPALVVSAIDEVLAATR